MGSISIDVVRSINFESFLWKMSASAMARTTSARGSVALSSTVFSTSTFGVSFVASGTITHRRTLPPPVVESQTSWSPRIQVGDVYRTTVGSFSLGDGIEGIEGCAARVPGWTVSLAGGLTMMKIHNVEPVLICA